MEWLNFNHLYYFWCVAREGSITRAASMLRLAQPTVSAQLRQLELQFPEPLFSRKGRGLVLTATGQTVFRYAEEIFALGKEMQDVTRGRAEGRLARLTVGIVDTLPKLVAYRILLPAMRAIEPVHLICDEGKLSQLLSSLARHELDLVISDSPVPAEIRVKAFSHLLGSCGVAVLARPELAARYRQGFPHSLDKAPMLLPFRDSSIRRELEHWFEANQVRPQLVGEFKDSALMKTFGQAGNGLFPVPMAIMQEVCEQYGVEVVGQTTAIEERFFAISSERKLRHPGVKLIYQMAKASLQIGQPEAPSAQ